jgi:hypothetical protein
MALYIAILRVTESSHGFQGVFIAWMAPVREAALPKDSFKTILPPAKKVTRKQQRQPLA